MALVAGGVSAGKVLIDQEESVNEAVAADGSWTIMVYMAADGDLEYEAYGDLMEMERIGGTDDVNILVLIDTYELVEGTHWYVVDSTDSHYDFDNPADHVCDCADVVGECPGEQNTGDGETLYNFIVSAVNYAPADNYMLVLWNHGGGWWGVCWDDSSLEPSTGRIDRLTAGEYGDAIRAAEVETGVHLDIIGFDACLVSMIEVAYEIRDLADYMIASVTSIPFAGLAYDLFLDDLVANPGMDALELGGHIVDGYMEFYRMATGAGVGVDNGNGVGMWSGITLSVIDLAEIDALADLMDELGTELLDIYNSGEVSRGTIISAAEANTPVLIQGGQGFPFVDIGLFAAALGQKIESLADLTYEIECQMAKVVPILDYQLPVSGGAFMTTGLTVYFPVSPTYTYIDYSYADAEEAAEHGEPFYYGLDFPLETSWDEFIFGFCPSLVWP